MQGQVFGRYRVSAKIGEGGMAEVWAARHELSGRDAVVKVLLPGMNEQPDIVKRFLQEAKAAACIQDPGIVDVIDVGYSEDARAFLILERLHGAPLADRVSDGGRMALDRAVSIVKQLARTMSAAHAHGIVHRDLKPDNLFIVRDPEVPGGERVKVLDFGLAKLMVGANSVQTMEGTVFGTPAYMAPEQCLGAGGVDHRADIYAIGCIFYRLLCGTAPFGHGGLDVLRAQLRAQPTPPRERDASIPEPISALIMRLLEKSPSARIQQCSLIIEQLDAGTQASVVDGIPEAISELGTVRVPCNGDTQVESATNSGHLDSGDADKTLIDVDGRHVLASLDDPEPGESVPPPPVCRSDSGGWYGQPVESPMMVHPDRQIRHGSTPSFNGAEIRESQIRRNPSLLWTGVGLAIVCLMAFAVVFQWIDDADDSHAEPADIAAPADEEPQRIEVLAPDRGRVDDTDERERAAFTRVARILQRVAEAMARGDWEQARQLLQQAATDVGGDLSIEHRRRIDDLRARLDAELQNQQRYDAMTTLRPANEPDAVPEDMDAFMSNCGQFSQDSWYRKRVDKMCAQVRERWLKDTEIRMNQLVIQGKCNQIAELGRQRDTWAPDAPLALEQAQESCTVAAQQLREKQQQLREKQQQLKQKQQRLREDIKDTSDEKRLVALCAQLTGLTNTEQPLMFRCGMAACRQSKKKLAKRMYRKLLPRYRKAMAPACLANGIEL